MACASRVECWKSPKVRVNCAQLVTSTASLVGPTDDSPMNAQVEVPTASIGFEPRSTSSMYTPGDRYDVAMDCSLPFGGWSPHQGGGLAWVWVQRSLTTRGMHLRFWPGSFTCAAEPPPSAPSPPPQAPW